MHGILYIRRFYLVIGIFYIIEKPSWNLLLKSIKNFVLHPIKNEYFVRPLISVILHLVIVSHKSKLHFRLLESNDNHYNRKPLSIITNFNFELMVWNSSEKYGFNFGEIENFSDFQEQEKKMSLCLLIRQLIRQLIKLPGFHGKAMLIKFPNGDRHKVHQDFVLSSSWEKVEGN